MAVPAWDVFCAVVDNLGDIGVCWRLAADLARRGQPVRLWVDRPDALEWMAPGGAAGVEVHHRAELDSRYRAADVIVAAFGCALEDEVLGAAAAAGRRVTWIQLEYLSAEGYAARSHGLASPLAAAAEGGVQRWFYFPGFFPQTGGLLRESDLLVRRAAFRRADWLAQAGIDHRGERIVSLFCYEPPGLAAWLMDLAREPNLLLVTAGRAAAAVRAAEELLPAGWNAAGRLRLHHLPLLRQTDFDRLLWSADWNFVRGEDSLVRAIWAGAPFVWQAYPQADGAHAAKLEAMLDALDAPPSLRRTWRVWNGLEAGAMPAPELGPWGEAVGAWRRRLAEQVDLTAQLLRFVAEKR